MTFQHRVMVHRNKLNETFLEKIHARDAERYPDGYAYYADIREVYYADAAKGTPPPIEMIHTRSAEPSAPASDLSEDSGPIDGIADDMKYYVLAVSLPPLNEWELPGYDGE